MEDKCPMMFSTGGGNCIKEHCAWWNEDNDIGSSCAILVIAWSSADEVQNEK